MNTITPSRYEGTAQIMSFTVLCVPRLTTFTFRMGEIKEIFDIRHDVLYAVTMLSESAFESRNVVKLVGVSERALRHWADRGIVVPDIADAVGRPGVRRRYSFENLLQAAMIKELLRQGMNLHEAGRMLLVYKNDSLTRHSPGRLYLIIQHGTAQVLEMKGAPTKARLVKLLEPHMAENSFSLVAIHQLKEQLMTRVKEMSRQ